MYNLKCDVNSAVFHFKIARGQAEPTEANTLTWPDRVNRSQHANMARQS